MSRLPFSIGEKGKFTPYHTMSPHFKFNLWLEAKDYLLITLG